MRTSLGGGQGEEEEMGAWTFRRMEGCEVAGWLAGLKDGEMDEGMDGGWMH